MNISFPENWQFNNKLTPPLLPTYPHNLTKHESKGNSKIPIFGLFSELGSTA